MRLLPLRFLIVVCLLAGATALYFMIRISGYPFDGAYYQAPGSATRFTPEILPRLGQIGGGVLGFGVFLLCAERFLVWRAKSHGHVPAERPKPGALRVAVSLVLSVLIGLVVVPGFLWWRYVTNTISPFDEVGITLNANAPGPVNAWGCARLQQTFGSRTLAPYGCADPDGGWR